MKQFAKPFLSTLMLLSFAAEAVESASGSGSTVADSVGDFEQSGTRNGSEERNGAREGGCDKSEGGHQFCSSTAFIPRPQGSNEARFFNPFWYGPDSGDQCFYLDVGYRYRQSWKSHRIAECLFGRSEIVFAGSEADHKKGEFLADNIGLSPNFRGTLKLEPRIRDHMFDFESRWELGSWLECLEGAYMKLRGTVVHTRWELRECETANSATNSTFSNFRPGYMSSVEDSTGSLPGVNATNSIINALRGDFTFGDMQEKWNAGRFKGRDNDTKLANFDIMAGYDFLLCDEYHLGLYIKTTAPTGTTPNSHEVFQAIAGNGHHWELGGGLDGHYEFWNCDDQSLAAYVNGYVTHLFKDTQWRLFDLKNSREGDGCLSRYTLLKEFNRDGTYAQHLIPGVNWLNRRVESSFAVQGDAAFRLLYRSCGWALGVGYNVFGRTHEKLQNACDSECVANLQRHVGIKGITDVATDSFVKNADTGLHSTTGQGFRLSSATQSEFRPLGPTIVPVDNSTPLENPRFVTSSSTGRGTTDTTCDSQTHEGKPAPVLLTCERDINFGKGENGRANDNNRNHDKKDAKNHDGTRSDSNNEFLNEDNFERRGIRSQISHKFFATVDYQWEDCEDYRPYLGVGGEVEFAQNGSCRVCTPNLWGAWVRTGINF